MNIDDRRTTTNDRPQGLFGTHFGKLHNDHNSATRHPIPFMFGSRVGFSGTADATAPFPVGSNPRWRPAAILKTSNGHISATHRPIDFAFLSTVEFSRTADRRTAPFPVVSGRHFVNSHGHIFETHYPIHFMYVHRPYFALGLYNDC